MKPANTTLPMPSRSSSSAPAAAALGECDCSNLWLSGLTDLAAAAARGLAAFKGRPFGNKVRGTLRLECQWSRSPEAAQALMASTVIDYLELNGLTTLSVLIERADVELPPIGFIELIPEHDGSFNDDCVIPDDFPARGRRQVHPARGMTSVQVPARRSAVAGSCGGRLCPQSARVRLPGPAGCPSWPARAAFRTLSERWPTGEIRSACAPRASFCMIDTTLTQTLLLLGVAIVILVAFRRLRIPASLGYLVVGVLLGSKTAGPVIPDDFIIIIAEFGIVFLLFSIGLTFSLSQIYALRHTVLLFGLAQVSLTTAVVAMLAWRAGLPPVAAFVVGAVCAQSSTTIISKQLLDQGEGSTRHGRLGIAMSVFQDITAVPFIVMIPVLGVADPRSIATALGFALFKVTVAVAVVLLVGRYVLRPLFHLVSQGRSFELFTLAVLFVSLAAAWATHSLGLSMAFGAFLAGMVLGETEFRHQVESAIRPFRDVLLGVFFISIGMLLDPPLLPSIWHQALVAALVLLAVKVLLVTAIVRAGGLNQQTAIRTGLILAVGGEFGFALLAIGLESRAIDSQASQITLNAILFSMVGAPLLIRFNEPLACWMSAWMPTSPPPSAESAATELESVRAGNHVVLCGYGRIGQIVGRFLEGENIGYVAIDIDPEIAREARLAGQSVYFGDSSDVTVLESAGVQEAALLILCHDDLAAALKTLRNARRLNAGLPIVVRTRDERHVKELRKAGASEVIPETLEAGVMIVSHALMVMKVPAYRIVQRLQEQRASRYQLLREFFRGEFPDRDALPLAGTDQLHSVPIADGSPVVGKTIGELEEMLERVAITTLARNGHPERSPPRSKRVEAGDVLVLLGSKQDLDRAEARLTGARPREH